MRPPISLFSNSTYMKSVQLHTVSGPNTWKTMEQQLIVMRLPFNTEQLTSENQLLKLIDLIIDERLKSFVTNNFSNWSHQPCEVAVTGQLAGALAAGLQWLVGAGDSGYNAVRLCREDHYLEAAVSVRGPQIGMLAAKLALAAVETLSTGINYDSAPALEKLRIMWQREKPGQVTGPLLEEAKKRRIPYTIFDEANIIVLGYGNLQMRIQKSFSGKTSYIGVKLSANKEATKNMLSMFGVPVPFGKTVNDTSYLAHAISEVGYPLVIKPLNGNNGRGVTVNITNYQDALIAFHAAKHIAPKKKVIIERFIVGFDYRLLVVNNRFVAAVRRTPAMVTGNGYSTIAELVEQANADPKRGPGHTNSLTHITIDDTSLRLLAAKGYTIATILPPGEKVFLKEIGNISAGGIATNVTANVHSDNILTAERIAGIIGLDICGLDIISPDIAIPFSKNGASVVEVNSAPGLRLHLDPADGEPIDVAGLIMNMLFPAGTPLLIPIITIIATKDKALIGPLIASILAGNGFKTGLNMKSCVEIQQIPLNVNRLGYQDRTRLLLSDPTIDIAIMVCDPEDVDRHGLLFPYCNTALLPGSSQPDSVTIGGMVNRVVLDTLEPNGYLVVNATEMSIQEYKKIAVRHTALYILSPPNEAMSLHLSSGGLAAVLERDVVVLYHKQERTIIFEMAEIGNNTIDDDTLAAVLAAILTSSVYGVRPEQIYQSLSAYFTSESRYG